MNNIKRNTLLTYLSGSYNVESNVNMDRIYELNSKPEKSGRVVYLCERELREEDNFGLNFAYEKSDDVKIIHEEKDIKGLNPSILVYDFNPLKDLSFLKKLDCKVYEVDSHNILPARVVSDKQEYSAATFRPKVYAQINKYLTTYPKHEIKNKEARNALKDFIKNRLDYYSEFRNDVSKNMTSGLSKYFNLGYLSSQRAVLEVLASNSHNENKEEFLEEVIVRKELADNFCLYNKNYKSLKGLPDWGLQTLISHKEDFREYKYTKKQFENAKTHDNLWNAAQTQLLTEGVIHSYLRMYWAKKILEWSKTPEYALQTAIYLNDTYAKDAPSANGYVGILWSIGGLHDRAFGEHNVFGKVRLMSYDGIKSKYDIEPYINKYIKKAEP